MAYDANRNQHFARRLKNAAIAFQNLREEGDRIRDWYFQEICVSGEDNAAFVDTPEGTVAEMKNMISYLTDFEGFNENGIVASGYRNAHLIPFLSDQPA